LGADGNEIQVGNVRAWSVSVQYNFGDCALCYSRLIRSLTWDKSRGGISCVIARFFLLVWFLTEDT
jgi:hypothetical protein